MKLYEPSTIRYIKNKYGFRFSKSLGQNFLTDKSVIDGIVDAAGIGPEDLVIEIGPGIGVLTQGAAERAGRVVAIEIDEGLLKVLDETLFGYHNVKVIRGDVLKIDLDAIIEEELAASAGNLRHVKIIGNLPYYITTPILMKLLESRIQAECITVMMQKEVAQRIASGPGSRIYGAISVAVQYYCEVTTALEVPKEVFMPQPKVDSTVLQLDVRDKAPVDILSEEMFFRLVKAGFSQRRKTLLNSLQSAGFTRDIVRKSLENAGIDPTRRAETLSLDDFARLSNTVMEKTPPRCTSPAIPWRRAPWPAGCCHSGR